jgi:AtzE family amidohydrolase
MISPASTALEIATAVRSRQVTAAALTEQALAALGPGNTRLNAFTAITVERARGEAAAVDAALAAGRDPGPLAGVPYGVKNLFDLAGVVTVAGSKINRDNPPAAQDATAVARLKAAGAVCLGALNMGEYAYDFVTENSHDGATKNPRDLSRSAGGSSGGSAAAVAAGLVPLSLGTDTNGSIRVPSAFCGIWGIKPTYGRLSRAGSFPFVGSLDHIGPFARTVGDLAVAYDVLQGPDPLDPVCTTREREPVSSMLGGGLGGLRVAVASGYFAEKGSAEARAGVEAVARALGATNTINVAADATTRARAAAFVITMAEGAALHLESLRKRAGDFDPVTRDRFLAGTLLPAAWYLKAQQYRQWWREHLRDVFRDVDVLLAPATPVSATSLGQLTMNLDGVEMLVRPNLGLFTQPISCVGLPVLAAPVQTAPMPVAVQLIAAPWREAELFRVAQVLESSGVCTSPVASVAA